MWVLNLINLSTASSMLLYDGSPFHPTPDILLKLAESVGYALSTPILSKRMLTQSI
jgi:acetoacetyl-CoA synthetase